MLTARRSSASEPTGSKSQQRPTMPSAVRTSGSSGAMAAALCTAAWAFAPAAPGSIP